MSIFPVVSYPSKHLALKPTILVWLACLLTACASSPDTPNSAGVREGDMLVLTAADDKRSAEVRVGEQVMVRLSENASTGFTWAVDNIDSKQLVLDNSQYIAPEQVGFVGASGTRVFTFTAQQPGESTLSFKYWRFWEGDNSVRKRLTAQVRVTP